jgi:hypothetical protein
MVAWEYRNNPREASGLDPEAVHSIVDTAGIGISVNEVG